MCTIEESTDGNDMESVCTEIAEPIFLEVQENKDIDWDVFPEVRVKIYTMRPPIGLQSLKKKTMSISVQILYPGADGSTTMRYHNTPFAKGACRWAFHAQVRDLDSDWGNHVTKRFISVKKKHPHGKARYMKAIEDSTIAMFLAQQWMSRKPANCKDIEFLPAYVAEVQPENTSSQWVHSSKKMEYFCCEPSLPDGEFQKFSNNAGDWDQALITDKTLLDFCKYTYDATRGYMMVTDLQGVLSDGVYHLTDPAVICEDVDRFGSVNLGPKGLDANIEMVRHLLQEF